MFRRAPSTVLRSERGNGDTYARRSRCIHCGTRFSTCRANMLSTRGNSVSSCSPASQSPAWYASPKPISPPRPSRRCNASGRCSRMAGAAGSALPRLVPSGRIQPQVNPADGAPQQPGRERGVDPSDGDPRHVRPPLLVHSDCVDPGTPAVIVIEPPPGGHCVALKTASRARAGAAPPARAGADGRHAAGSWHSRSPSTRGGAGRRAAG